jgi:hypothetical protein
LTISRYGCKIRYKEKRKEDYKMTTERLKKILDLHKKWLRNEGGERADLSGENLRYASLQGAELNRANLRNADLKEANLTGANLAEADLSCSFLWNANLRNTDLRRANLKGADLEFADLSYTCLKRASLNEACLRGVCLQWADLQGADLTKSDLQGANLEHVIYDEYTSFYALQCPEEGAFIGWKKCENGVIVKLLIPADAKRSSATSRKCRASKAIVLEIIGSNRGISTVDTNFIYEVGKEMIPDSFDEDRWRECSHGIHFFITKAEAERY